jgi:hypothetical protein
MSSAERLAGLSDASSAASHRLGESEKRVLRRALLKAVATPEHPLPLLLQPSLRSAQDAALPRGGARRFPVLHRMRHFLARVSRMGKTQGRGAPHPLLPQLRHAVPPNMAGTSGRARR